MAGTYAEQATLATTNAFIDLVKVALIQKAIPMTTDAALLARITTAETQISNKQSALDNAKKDLAAAHSELVLYKAILADSSGYAAKMAWLVAAGNPTIGAAAPAVPSSADTQYAVNTSILLLNR